MGLSDADLGTTAKPSGSGGLRILHERLEAHFLGLRTQRDQLAGPGFPIFALEHGLGEGELTLLASTVRGAVQHGALPSAAYLPAIVYATEIGYDYTGDEYWQTFSARTPGWAVHGERDYIRRGFLRFASGFGGARPSGLWADHFSIICWPITHAVLPLDLQRQLVQLLFDYRTALTSALLADPPELGIRLAARAWSYSSRFQNLAQNTGLLGQIAAALLAGEDEQSPYLLDSTLTRIVRTLATQRQARMWLRDARSSASRVRTRGLRGPVSPAMGEIGPDRPRLPAPSDPVALLQLTERGWVAYLRMPDLSVLAERLPELHEQLGRLRVRVSGSLGAPLARRRLLAPGQLIRLDEWPDRRVPLLQLESDAEAANRLLADQCVLSPGPVWLFLIRERGLATEVRGKFVRPGQHYVLLGPTGGCTNATPGWVTPAACATSGVTAYDMQVPAHIDASDIDAVRLLGLSMVADVDVRPVGVVPCDWDGEGAAAWLVGEEVTVAVSSNQSVAKYAITVNGTEPAFMEWPENGTRIYVTIRDLAVGEHDVRIALLPDDDEAPLTEGSLLVSMRAARAQPATGTVREGLLMVASPAQPTLNELWEGRAAVELLGPADAEVTITAKLEDGRGAVLASAYFQARIPVSPEQWLVNVARRIREYAALQDHYDQAEALVITAGHPQLGVARLRCERPFAPLRWAVRRDRDGAVAWLIDNTESGLAEVTRHGFATPTEAERIALDPDRPLRWPTGGLLRARAREFESSVILPPHVRQPSDLVVPHVPAGPRTVETVVSLTNLSAAWASASLPGDPFAQYERRAVLRAITARLASDMAGTRWARIEELGARDDEYSFRQLLHGVGEETYQRNLAAAIRGEIARWQALEPHDRAEEFAAVLSRFDRWTRVEAGDWPFAEFLLRLASDPATVAGWPEERLNASAGRVIVSPVLMRAARFVVLAVHLDESDDTGTVYRGWSWA
jgi:hypothetical protein